MAAAFRLLANAFEMMRGRPAGEGNSDGDLLASMVEYLRANADDPPTELKGVPDSFFDELERVPKETLKPSDTCPICVNPFLDGRLRITGEKSLADLVQTSTRSWSSCHAMSITALTWTAYARGSS